MPNTVTCPRLLKLHLTKWKERKEQRLKLEIKYDKGEKNGKTLRKKCYILGVACVLVCMWVDVWGLAQTDVKEGTQPGNKKKTKEKNKDRRKSDNCDTGDEGKGVYKTIENSLSCSPLFSLVNF